MKTRREVGGAHVVQQGVGHSVRGPEEGDGHDVAVLVHGLQALHHFVPVAHKALSIPASTALSKAKDRWVQAFSNQARSSYPCVMEIPNLYGAIKG